MKPRLYLDTSIIGGYFDDEWQEATRELFRQAEVGLHIFVTSVVTVRELAGAPEAVRERYRATFREPEEILELTDEAETLAQAYVAAGVVTPKYIDDARHVAIATVSGIGVLVSWNFHHLANVRREAGFNAVNLLRGFRQVRIVSPHEVIHENDEEI